MLDINIEDDTSFLARLQFSKHAGKEILSTRGISILYSATAEVLAITVAVKIAKYYHLPTMENVVPLRQSETQTEIVETRSIQTQVHCSRSTVGSNTEFHLLSVHEIEEAVANVVAHHLHSRRKSAAVKPPETTSTTTKPASVHRVTPKPHLGKNIVPRMQKLRVLDKMICERTAIVESFDSYFVKSEVARKRNIIMQSRLSTDNLKSTQTTRKPEKTDVTTLPEQIMPNDKVEDGLKSISTSNSDGRTEESEETDESSKSQDLDEEMSSSASSLSERSSSSSKETVLRKISIADLTEGKSKTVGEQRYRFTQQKPEEVGRDGTAEQLSPTSLYLKELREKILQERLQKI